MQEKKFSLDGNQLKLIALFFMIFDHVKTYLLWNTLPGWTSWLARFVAPLFVYILVEGFHKTSSKRRYLMRIIGAAMITWIGEIIINFSFHNVDPFTHKMTIYSLLAGNNILVTLSLLLGVMWSIDLFRQNKHQWYFLVLALVLSIGSLMFEGGIYLLPVLLIFYGFYGQKKQQIIGMIILCSLLLIKALYNAQITGMGIYQTLTFDNEWMMILVVPFIELYNGLRGNKNWLTKYLFYVIYPVHLWILMIISALIK